MCGIAGLILAPGAPPPDPAILHRMIDTLHHRGPDGSGQTVAGRVALLHKGSLLALDTPDALRRSLPGSLFEVLTTDHRKAVTVLRGMPGVADVQTFGERAHVRLTDSRPDAAPQLSARLESAGVGVTMVRQVSASLEDVFVSRLGESEA